MAVIRLRCVSIDTWDKCNAYLISSGPRCFMSLVFRVAVIRGYRDTVDVLEVLSRIVLLLSGTFALLSL